MVLNNAIPSMKFQPLIRFNIVGSEQVSIAADNKIAKLKKWSTIYEQTENI